MEKYKMALKTVAREICDDRCVCNSSSGGGKCKNDYEYEAGKAISAVAKLLREGKLSLSEIPINE